MTERIIFHIDVNSAFLSWEAARQVQEGKPDIRLVPSAICKTNTVRSAIILAKSTSATKYKVKTGEPIGIAKKKCPQLIVFPPDFQLYEEQSRKFIEICKRFSPTVQKYSIDECFLDMSGTELLYKTPLEAAKIIQDTIQKELNFTVNIGISNNKLLAKMASDLEKPNKICTIFKDEIEEKMWDLPISDLFFVGRSTSEKLQKYAIRKIRDIALADKKFIQYIIGNKLGAKVHDFANGIDESPVEPEEAQAKGYSISTTCEKNIVNKTQAKKILYDLAEKLTYRLRKNQVKSSCVSILTGDINFINKSHQIKLDEPSDETLEIFETAKILLNELWDETISLRLVGLSLTEINSANITQQKLFKNENKTKLESLNKSIDKLRDKYGKNSIVRGISLDEEK